MAARIKSIQVSGFKSIEEMPEPLELGPVNVLIGANGSGKSNLIAFLRMLHELADERFRFFVAQQGGPSTLLHKGPSVTRGMSWQLNLDFDGTPGEYTGEAVYAPPETLIRFREDARLIPKEGGGLPRSSMVYPTLTESILWRKGESSPAALECRKLLDGCRTFHFHDTSPTSPMRRSSYVVAVPDMYPDGGNLPALLHLYSRANPEVYKRIVSSVRKVVPDFKNFVLSPGVPNEHSILLNWVGKDSGYILGPHQFSDGSLRAIALLTLLLRPEPELPRVIILDEPELGLHPAAVGFVADAVRYASMHTQVIVATQSPQFVDHFNLGDLVVAEPFRGSSRFRRLDAESLKHWLERYSTGELWEKNVFGGGPFG